MSSRLGGFECTAIEYIQEMDDCRDVPDADESSINVTSDKL